MLEPIKLQEKTLLQPVCTTVKSQVSLRYACFACMYQGAMQLEEIHSPWTCGTFILGDFNFHKSVVLFPYVFSVRNEISC